MKKFVEVWNQYWFRPFPVIYLDIARVVAVGVQVSVMVFYRKTPVELARLVQTPELYWPLPIVKLFSLPMGLDWVPSLTFLHTLYTISLVAGIFALFGILTRISLALLTLGSLFLQGYMYSYGDIHHSDPIMMFFLFFLTMSPAGRTLSIDAMFNKDKTPWHKVKSNFALWPLLCLQWYMAWIYFSAAYAKVAAAGFDWANGITLQYYYVRAWLYRSIPIAEWFASQNMLSILSSWATLIFEAGFFLVMFNRKFLWPFILFGLGFHVTIAFLMGAYFFELTALYIVFLPWLIETLPKKIKLPQPVEALKVEAAPSL